MEVVASLSTNINGANGGTKKHIQEWSRLDKLTGLREHARVEADHWASNTSNSRHHFGKVVDSRARNLADGSVQQKQQTKQLEVFQAHIPGGSVQVIRSHTSTTSSWHNSKVLQSPSSTWTSSSNPTDNLLKRHIGDMEVEIDSLKFDHNPVNLETEKAKVNIARHLINRRPPTRSKITKINSNDTVFTNLPITYDFNEENKNETNDNIDKNTDITKISSLSSSRNTVSQILVESGREKLDKKKSISDENLSFNSHLDDGNVEEKVTSSPWMRSCRTRWSFQHPTSSRYKEKIETAEENRSELENVLKKFLRNKPDFESYSKNISTVEFQKPKPLYKKSFVTEATLQETKRKLRHLSKDKVGGRKNSSEEVDDGIFTESKCNSDKEDEKAVTHEDLESALIKNPSPKCLEFRAVNKSDDWFDRRKSYGFEPVRQTNISSSLNSTPKTNSSTDSGICRSSELELASTSIVKKVTEAKDDKIHPTNDEQSKSGEVFGNNEVSELMRKFEKLDKSKIGTTVITFSEVPKIKVHDSSDSQREIVKKGRVSEAIKSFERNGINCKTSEPTSLTKIGSYFLNELDQKQNQITTESDFLAKRHSIACDDTKYMTSTFNIPESSFPEKICLPGKTTVVNVNNSESCNSPSPFTDADTKKPKKVEFSKTEVHFAATEPGKIRIVETDEKPPPTNLYRKKKRSVSVSPKSDLPQIKFGVYDNFTDTENTPDRKSNDTGFRSPFTSTVSDNGLAVTISSTKPTDYRRASWSVIEDLNSSPIPLENKPAYSTKINFGREGVTVVADSKSPQYEKVAPESRSISTKTTSKTKYPDASQHGESIHERLIVSIGGSASGNRTTGKYLQKPTFTNSFRNSIKSSKAAIGLEKLSSKKNDSLKSTSLIINTIKQSANKKPAEKTNNKIVENENEASYAKKENAKHTAEQPSTYITEMNKLQRKYRVKENQSVMNGVIKNEKNINRFYNTIPAVKNGYARSKLLNNDLPAVLNAFDNLCRTIDEVMEKKTNSKNQNSSNNVDVAENLSVSVKAVHEERSSQSRFLYDAVKCDDGNISDDSLKADKEVQSYMSTAIMEEYENELCGSWSRKRYFKHIKPIKIVHQDEISEKCHFKPLKNNEDELKIIANVVDVKKPKIASVVMNLDNDKQRDGNSARNPKKSTVLLNKSPNIETVINDMATKQISDHVNTTRNLHQTTNSKSIPSKTNDYVNIADLKEAKQSNTSTKPSLEEMFKKETEPAKIIYHNIELSDKAVQNENEKKSYLPRRDSDRDIAKQRKKIDSKESIVSHGSIRRSTKSTNSKEKLPDSGRDGWLNLPKERKALSERKTIENGKHEIYRKPHIDHVKKDKRIKSGMNGYGDISSEEDSTRRSGKLYIPLSTIPEKSKVNKTSKFPVTKMASNSSTETQSNSIEFKNPVLKTEERSRRRAARMLQRASSREMLMNSNIASSSDDVTSENEVHYSRSSKPRNIRKLKSSPKTVKPDTTSNLPPKKTVTSSAKMQINIFNIKDRTNSERRSGHIYNTSSRSSNCIDDNKSSKSRPHTGQREIHPNIPEKSRSKQVSCNSRDTRNMSTSTTKSTRPIR